MNDGKFDFGLPWQMMRKDLSICIAEANERRTPSGGRRSSISSIRSRKMGASEGYFQPAGALER